MNQTGVFICCVRYGSAAGFSSGRPSDNDARSIIRPSASGRSDRLELSSLRLELWIFLPLLLAPCCLLLAACCLLLAACCLLLAACCLLLAACCLLADVFAFDSRNARLFSQKKKKADIRQFIFNLFLCKIHSRESSFVAHQ